MADGDVGSLPDPMGETVGQVKKKGDWTKQVAKLREESLTELDDELTPFKKVMGEKGKVSVKVLNELPCWRERGKQLSQVRTQ